MKMISRDSLLQAIQAQLKRAPVTTILGPRQCGKTTISRVLGKMIPSVFFDLEDTIDFQTLSNTPQLTLQAPSGTVIIDEIQRLPAILPILRVLADSPGNPARFLLLGSSSPELIKGASESLAGRIAFVDMSGFDMEETGPENLHKLWMRGGFPLSYIADNESGSFKWRQDFIRTFLERDIPQLGITIPADALRRFWTMLAHYHGQIWNAAQFGRSIGASEMTARRYLDLLSGAYVVRQLQPWFENSKKRQVKSPKVYIRDSGLMHALLMLEGAQIMNHPKVGASWEGFIIEQIISQIKVPVYFWATHAGAELDLLTFIKGKPVGFEIKLADAPSLTKSMQIAMDDLHLDRLFVIYPGLKRYKLQDNIEVVPAVELIDLCLSLIQ